MTSLAIVAILVGESGGAWLQGALVLGSRPPLPREMLLRPLCSLEPSGY